MRPTRTLEMSLHFASRLSPAWLLLAMPLVLGLGFFLYYREINILPRRRITVLCALRLTLLGLVVLAVFMPNLDIVKRLVFPGRIVILVDNSESMTIADSSMPPLDALELARRGRPNKKRKDEPRTGFFQLALHLEQVLAQVGVFQRQAAGNKQDDHDVRRAATAFMDLSTAALVKCEEIVRRLPLDPLSPESRAACKTLQQDIHALGAAIADIRERPQQSSAALSQVRKTLERLLTQSRRFQLEVDEDSLGQDDKALQELSAGIISTKRLDLVNERLGALIPAIRKWVPGQYLQIMDMISGEIVTLGRRSSYPPLTAARGKTDIRTRLHDIIAEDSLFPLTAVVVVSDGLDLNQADAADLLKEYVSRRVPIYCAGVGHLEEPYDLAVAAVRAPPLAVNGQRTFVEVQVKAAVKEAATGKVLIRQGEREVAAVDVDLRRQRQVIYVPLTPETEGVQRYTVALEATADDAFKDRNNVGDFVVEVRRDRLRVLLLDGRPRWQTRFVVNTLSRLPYVDLNSIIRIVQEDGVLLRGRSKGSWPESAAALDIYDIVVLGRFETEVLQEDEWRQLASFAEAKGKALVFLAPGNAEFYPNFVQRLMPLPAVAAPQPLAAASLADLRLTAEGELHPLTRSFQSHLPVTPFERQAPTPESLVLLHNGRTGRPLASCRFVGQGRTLMLHSDRLGVCLNQRYLRQHSAIFVNLVEWATREKSASVVMDQQALREGDAFQAWAAKAGGEVTVVDSDGKVAARAGVVPAQGSPALHKAVFAPLPPGEFAVRRKKAASGRPLHVLADNEEVVWFAQRASYLRHLARVSGGRYRPFSEIEALFPAMSLKERAEVHRYLFQAWRSQLTLLLLLLLLSVEWVLRKYWSLV